MVLHAKETPDKLRPFGPLARVRLYLFYIQLFQFTLQPSKLKFLLGRHWQPTLLVYGDFFTNQVARFKILGAMATEMVATWRVAPLTAS